MTDVERIELQRAIAESDIAGCSLENADIDALVGLFESWLERRSNAVPLDARERIRRRDSFEDQQRIKEALDNLPDFPEVPTDEQAEAVLQAFGTSGKEVVNGFIEQLMRDNLELKCQLAAALTTQAAAVPLDAERLTRVMIDAMRGDSRFDEFWVETDNQSRAFISNRVVVALAAALASTPSVGDALVEVKRLRDEWRFNAQVSSLTTAIDKWSRKAEVANEIFTALEALQPSTPSEQKEND